MTKFNIENAEGIEHVEKWLHDHPYLSGNSHPNETDAHILSQLKDAPDRAKHPNFFAWWWNLSLFQEAARATWGKHHGKDGHKDHHGKDGHKEHHDKKSETKECAKAEPKAEAKPAKKDEDELDLFGEETEEDKKAMEELKKKKAADEAAKKTEKKKVIAKSSVVFNVKAYEETFDFVALGKRIREEIHPEGLVWQKEFKILPVAYQIKMLQCGMIVEDDKISPDDILEKIQELWPDDIQSCDIVEFNKV